MMEAENIVVLVTTISMEEAQRISGLLLSQKKVACVNIINEASSMFWWKGKIETTKESLMIIKSRMSRLDDIVSIVKSVHSYEVPEIIALPIIGGSAEYLKWVGEEVSNNKQQ
jgi:periplasmic divalent cation tolerance protein